MAVRGQIQWFSPDRRGIIPLDRFHVPARLRRVLRQAHFDLSVDRAFRDVITACASRADVTGNWIDAKIIESYKALHDADLPTPSRLGRMTVSSAAVRRELPRGLFLVSRCFTGRPMRRRWPCVRWSIGCKRGAMSCWTFRWLTPHLERLGAIEVSRQQYLQLLAESMQVERAFV